jgi:3-deoxy-7-phosphoheptulonate synthase
VIADPSHAAGVRAIVPALTLAGLAAGAQGAIIEVHPDPEHAMSDGAQSLDIPGFAKLAAQIRSLDAVSAG